MRRFLTFLLLVQCVSLRAATTNQIVIRDITWQFDGSVAFGRFVNGDYWVVGPVTVTNMLPEWDGAQHGWETNPVSAATTGLKQGFSTNVSYYDVAKRPAMPLTLASNVSLVKVKGGNNGSASMIKSAEVLTVLASAPPNNGTNYFRPPYVGNAKPLYQVGDLQTNLLPSLSASGLTNTPTLENILGDFSKCLRMDHHNDRARQLRPWDAMKDYQPENTAEVNEAMCRLMLDDPIADKLPALVMFAQHALDRAYVIYGGYRDAGTGHNPNQRIMAAWGACMFDIAEIKTYLATADGFHEDKYLWVGSGNAIPLWGQVSTELAYWNYIIGVGGNRANRDPYGWIDGGKPADYQFIVSQSLKGSALVARLMPELQACFPTNRLSTLFGYAERWVTNGYWTLPDPAAPYDGVRTNYGITFGPNGSGSFIPGSGRNPTKHGSSADGGQYKSTFMASVWDAYYTPWSPAPEQTNAAPVFTSSAMLDGQVGTEYNHVFIASGYPSSSFTVTSGSLPPGLELLPSGVVSGTPSALGDFSGVVTASNGVSPDDTQSFAIEIAPTSAEGGLPSGDVQGLNATTLNIGTINKL
jgi:hypothetical protein